MLVSCSRDGENGTVHDIDGNIYMTVRIGDQVWMAENLRTTRLRDNTPINEVTDRLEWYNASEPAYCWYDNDSEGKTKGYGVLYNYYTINTEKLCPEGWRIPADEDFQILIEKFDREADFTRHEISTIAGGYLKTDDAIKLQSTSAVTIGKNVFSALTGGCRSFEGDFSQFGSIGYFAGAKNKSLSIRVGTSSAYYNNSVSSYVGVSVRCIKQ